MREILFRGKNADNGEWVYGSYLHTKKIRLCIVRDESEVEENTQHLIVQDALACDWGFKNGMQVVDVLPETVGQFTGLTDKNGKDVFDGDIVLIEGINGRCVIEYHEETACWYIHVLSVNKYLHLFNHMDEIEVLGNIYEEEEE